MTIPLYCVLVAFLMIYVPKIAVAVGMARAKGGYDNRSPRDQQAKLEGWARRATAAHYNAFEAFGPFAAAVLISHLAHADARWSSALSLTFIAARTLYPILYIANLHKARSSIWGVGFAATCGLFLLPLF